WPACHVAADRCQVHHIDAHKHGGQPTPTNLAMLCRYHNGVNDDDRHKPGKKHRGRMRRHRGKVRLSTPGGRLVENTHALSSLGRSEEHTSELQSRFESRMPSSA